MKFFLDTANLDDLRQALPWGIVDGVTTNPSLIAKEGFPIEEQIRRICDLIDGDISAPVLANTAAGMIEEGIHLSKVHRNVVVKIPMTEQGIEAVSVLSREGIRTNVTLCFTAVQTLIAAKAGAYIVSPFIGRVDDIGASGTALIQDIAAIFARSSFNTQILAASIRGPLHVLEAAKAGAHVATMSLQTLRQLFAHPLTDKGLEQFLIDSNRLFETARS